jgi:asparagine synthetase B (glutamine-hydrolysing)
VREIVGENATSSDTFGEVGPRLLGISGRFSHSTRCDRIMWSPVAAGKRMVSLLQHEPGSAVIVQASAGGREERVSLDRPSRIALSGFCSYGRSDAGSGISSEAWLLELEAALDRDGAGLLRNLPGDFSLCYVTPDFASCAVYRSLTGTRPLYFRRAEGSVTWSTHPIDLFEGSTPRMSDVRLELLPALATAGDIDPSNSCFREIERLPAGYLLLIRRGLVQITAHDEFRPLQVSRPATLSDAADEFRSLVGAATRRRFSGSDRVGVFLSGGLDSAVAAYEVRKVAQDVVGFHWSWRVLPELEHELEAARLVAEALGIRLIELDFSASVGTDGKYVDSMREASLPFNHSFYQCFAATAVAAAEQGVELLTSGHLGDALFTATQADVSLAHLISPWEQLLHRLGSLWSLRPWHTPSSSYQAPRVDAALPWLSPEAAKLAGELGNHRYPAPEGVVSPDVYEAIKRALHHDSEHDAALQNGPLGDAGIALAHLYPSRELVELALSLSSDQRCRLYAGMPISKLPMRAAYLDRLPAYVVRRESRAPYIAVAENFARNNRDQLWTLLGEGSRLAELGVVRSAAIRMTLESPAKLRASAGALVRSAGVELWLRGLEVG